MKTSKYKIKIVCGYRKDQEFTIDANEAHKAFYLFENTDERGTFQNGLAIKGSDIQRIEPDYNATAGYNTDHQLTGEDMKELAGNGTVTKMQGILVAAKEIARLGIPEDLATPMHTLLVEKYPQIALRGGSTFAQKVIESKK